MTTPNPEVKTAWSQFEADMKALREELRRHYEPARSASPDLQSALNKLGQAADEVFESLGRATRDPDRSLDCGPEPPFMARCHSAFGC